MPPETEDIEKDCQFPIVSYKNQNPQDYFLSPQYPKTSGTHNE